MIPKKIGKIDSKLLTIIYFQIEFLSCLYVNRVWRMIVETRLHNCQSAMW